MNYLSGSLDIVSLILKQVFDDDGVEPFPSFVNYKFSTPGTAASASDETFRLGTTPVQSIHGTVSSGPAKYSSLESCKI